MARKKYPYRMLVTIPPEVRRWLRKRASFNGGSQSSEVVRAVRKEMQRVDGQSQPTKATARATGQIGSKPLQSLNCDGVTR